MENLVCVSPTNNRYMYYSSIYHTLSGLRQEIFNILPIQKVESLKSFSLGKNKDVSRAC